MPSIASSVGNLLQSIFDFFQALLSGVLAVVQHAFALVGKVLGTLLDAVRMTAVGLGRSVGGVLDFVTSHFAVLLVLTAAVGGYAVYQRRQGKPVVPPQVIEGMKKQ